MKKNKNNTKEKELKGNRKEDLDRIRGMRDLLDPERGPSNR
ncbi:MAG: hypothetical protein ACOY46_00695 [Bacillota bacterium]